MSREVMQMALDALEYPMQKPRGRRLVAIEALKAELAQPEPEPIAYAILEGRNIEDSAWGFIASWPEICHETINDAINIHDIEGAALWRVVPLYGKEET
jgi:hypothetical protein